jgi:hypothetical protein
MSPGEGQRLSDSLFIPYAVFCEDFLEAADGTVTIERIIDKIEFVEKSGPSLRDRADLPSLQVKYAVCFKSAEPIAGLQTKLRCTLPSGSHFVAGTKTLDLAGDYKGTFLSGELLLRAEENGWHIFDVLVDEFVKTRMVLYVSVQPQTVKENFGNASVRKNVTPSADNNTFAHPKCYARLLGNCSKEISKEHFISRNILDQLHQSGGLRVGGMPWNAPGAVVAISPASLAGKVLCRHHNSLLSDLDVLGGRFFSALNSIHAASSGSPSSLRNAVYQFDGNGIERFFLKILLGGVASGNLRGPGGTTATHDFDASLLRRLFGEDAFLPPTGMFLLGELNVPWLVEQPLQAAALIDSGTPVGVLVSIAPLRFALAVVPPVDNSPLLSGKSFYRPATITMANLTNGKIIFTWEGKSGNEDIVVGRAQPPNEGKDAPPFGSR